MFYEVTWKIDVDADNAIEAAERAREMQLDPDALVHTFTVTPIDDDGNATGEIVQVDVDPR